MLTYLFTAGRILLGVIFLVMGVDYFVSFLPGGAASPRGEAFLDALVATSYLFPFIKVVEIVSGLLLLSGRAVLPALLLVAPISVNIALYHAVLDRNGAWLGFLAFALTVILLVPFRQALVELFRIKPALAETARAQLNTEGLLAHSDV